MEGDVVGHTQLWVANAERLYNRADAGSVAGISGGVVGQAHHFAPIVIDINTGINPTGTHFTLCQGKQSRPDRRAGWTVLFNDWD